MRNDSLRGVLISIATLVSLGVLSVGVYAVFNSTNGSGTAALLAVGALGLFATTFHDRIRSMEFGGAKIQFALQVSYSLKKAFQLRLTGDYERAAAEIERAFDRFVFEEPPTSRQEYLDAAEYQTQVLTGLEGYVRQEFGGSVLKTSSTVSFLPLIDAVMTASENGVRKALGRDNKIPCDALEQRLKARHELRTAVIVRPGPALDTARLVSKLQKEVAGGALGIDCFLLIQNCKDSESRRQFCNLIHQRDMHAKSIAWEPVSGQKALESAFMQAMQTICDPSRCGYLQARIVD
jgi:hypothetical protein